MDYWPWGLLALAAIVFGGVSILAIPLTGLVGLGVLAYYGWVALMRPSAEDRDDERG
jgi:hypothetical protein